MVDVAMVHMFDDGVWQLSPAYDIGYAYNPNGGWTATHQMSVNGKFDDITRQDMLEFALQNNIKDAAHIIEEICETDVIRKLDYEIIW